MQALAWEAAAAGHPVTVWAPRAPSLPRPTPTLPYALETLPGGFSRGFLDAWLLRRAFTARLAPRLTAHSPALAPAPSDAPAGPPGQPPLPPPASAILHLAEAAALESLLPLPALARLPGGLRLVLTLHGSEILRFPSRPRLRRAFLRLLPRVDRLHVLSSWVEERLLAAFPDAAGRIVRLPGAPPPPPAPSAFLPRPEVRPGWAYLLCLARCHPRKGQLALLQALASLPPAERAHVEVWCAGPLVHPGYFRACAAFARQAGLHVQFIAGADDALRAWLLRSATLLVLPSVPHPASVEGFGLVCLEAAAAGLPVVAHRTGGVADAVDPGRNALLVDPADPSALPRALRELLASPARRADFSAASRAFAARHSWAHAIPLLYS